jgi:hypothetical protein
LYEAVQNLAETFAIFPAFSSQLLEGNEMEKRPYGIVPCTEGPIGYKVKRYRERAETLKLIAEEVIAEPIRNTLLQVANTYEAMAQDAARAH